MNRIEWMRTFLILKLNIEEAIESDGLYSLVDAAQALVDHMSAEIRD